MMKANDTDQGCEAACHCHVEIIEYMGEVVRDWIMAGFSQVEKEKA